MAPTLWLCWLTASSFLADEVPKDDPLIFDRRLSQWSRLLADESPKVRWSAARSLGRIGPQASAAVPALIEALKDEDESVRMFAAWALPRVGPQAKDVPALIEAFKGRRGVSGVAEALGQIGPEAKDALPALRERPGIWSAYAIVQIDSDDKTGIPYLIEQLENFEDRHVQTRMAILRALGRVGPRAKAALPVLKEMMLDKDQYLRMEVAYAVARIDPSNKIGFDILLTTLADVRKSDAASAAKQFGLMGAEAKAALPALIRALQAAGNGNNLVREYIADALGEIGQDAKGALSTLRELTTHPNQRVREAATLAIHKIEKP
jgi:HEAT repeat protein